MEKRKSSFETVASACTNSDYSEFFRSLKSGKMPNGLVYYNGTLRPKEDNANQSIKLIPENVARLCMIISKYVETAEQEVQEPLPVKKVTSGHYFRYSENFELYEAKCRVTNNIEELNKMNARKHRYQTDGEFRKGVKYDEFTGEILSFPEITERKYEYISVLPVEEK